MPTQRYNATYGKFGKVFLGILPVELDGVGAKEWNAERMIIFQSVILQCAQGVKIYAQIRNHILFRLNF